MLFEMKNAEPPRPSDHLPTSFYHDIRHLLTPYVPPAITTRLSRRSHPFLSRTGLLCVAAPGPFFSAANRFLVVAEKSSIAEMRIINVIFVNLDFIYVSGEKELQLLQEAVTAMQKEIYQYDGTVRQFLVDDKGSVMIGVFGTPPNAHEDDASRAVMTAIGIQKCVF